MPRVARIAPGGLVYHVLNRGVGKTTLFRGRRDYETFQRSLIDSLEKVPIRVVGYCVMPNHWHLLLWPRTDGELARFMLRLTTTHVRRWIANRPDTGGGHVYQGRYKSFPVQSDEHLATVRRYVERNPVRAKLADSCMNWPWSSAGQSNAEPELQVELAKGIVRRRDDWVRWTDRPQAPAEELGVQRSIREGRPFGGDRWLQRLKSEVGWREPLKRGRPTTRGIR